MKPIRGHALLHEGRTKVGYFHLDNGFGPASCECGVESPDLTSTAARKRWHKEHKAEVLAAVEEAIEAAREREA